MDLVDVDLCVVLPIPALDTWVRADPATRVGWLTGASPVREVKVAEHSAFVFQRDRPRPTKAIVVSEPRRVASVVVTGKEAAARLAIDAPAARLVLANVHVPGALLVIGGDLAHADVAGGTPVAGPHRMLDLEPGDYQVELRTLGSPGEDTFAQVISFSRHTGA
jgi:hypothetical protein